MTVKGAPTLIKPTRDPSKVVEGGAGKIPTRHEMEKERAKKEAEAEKGENIPSHSQIGTIPSLVSSELLAVKAGGPIKGQGGTHRFTLVDKDAVPLINGKKVSGCE